MSTLQISGKMDARKTKQQLIDELRSIRRQLAAAQRTASPANTKTKNLQQKFDEVSLERSLLETIIDIAADAIISIDQNHNIVRFNQGAQHIFGYRHQEIIGCQLHNLLPGEYRAAHKAHVRDFECSESESRMMKERDEIVARRKDGTRFPAIASISKSHSNGTITMTVFLRDISDIKQRQEQYNRTLENLAHVNRLNVLGELSASLAHELNQPLTAILANASVIQKRLIHSAAMPDDTVEAISDIVDDTKRAATVIQRLRSLSKRRDLHVESLDLNKLIVETGSLLRSQLLMSQTQFSLELDPAVSKVSSDRIQLQQVLLNVLTNAMDATSQCDPPDRRVLISTRNLKSNSVEIVIKDSGTGLKNEPYRNLMQPFFTTKKNGMGMGLAISKSILQIFGGRIWAEDNRGPGASFRIILPMTTKLVTTPEAELTRELKPNKVHARVVFIIDDDKSIRNALGRLVRSAGYQVRLFANAEEFQQCEVQVEAGCIVLDLHLPGASGIELQEIIKKRKCSLPIIFITGGGDTKSGVQAMKQGAVEFLSKPIDEKQFLDTVARALENSSVTLEREIQQRMAQEVVVRLTPRETEIMNLVITGMRNKQIATSLGISETTVKVHRGRVMHKVKARTVADLIRIANLADTESAAAL